MTAATEQASPAVGPRFERRQCIEVACNLCGETYGEDGAVHFASISDALSAIGDAEWLVTDDALRCYDCIDHRGHAATIPVVVHKCEYCWPPLFSGTPMPSWCKCSQRDSTIAHGPVPFVGLAHPGFTAHSCVALFCGQCGDPVGGDDEREPHFSSPQRALSLAVTQHGWTVTDTVACCRRCARRGECAVNGHRFPEQAVGTTRAGAELRWCTNCNQLQDKEMSAR